MSGYYYLAGPMRGIPEFNFPAFRAATADLRMRGLTIVSPAEEDEQTHSFFGIGMAGTEAELDASGVDLAERIAIDVRFICNKDCIGMYALPGWSESEGVAVEFALIKFLRKQFIEYQPLEKSP